MYCEIVFVDRMVAGKWESLMVMDWNYEAWIGCYCKVNFDG